MKSIIEKTVIALILPPIAVAAGLTIIVIIITAGIFTIIGKKEKYRLYDPGVWEF